MRHLFWAHAEEVQYSRNQFKFLLPQAGAFGNNMKKNHKSHAQNWKKYVYYISTENVCSASNLMQVVVFCNYVLIFRTTTEIFSLWR